jgi:mannan endo-1,6-alpha-mannosidase
MVRAVTLVSLAAISSQVYGLHLDPSNAGTVFVFFSMSLVKANVWLDSIKSAASTLASGVVSNYKGNQTGETPGLLPVPYSWWEAGSMFDLLIQYWSLTGDDQYNALVSQGLQFQKGDGDDFVPTNQTKSIGSDDQAIWALAAMSAAETKFPESNGNPTWLSLADAVFNEQARRWDTQSCNGGLRWQFFLFNNGYNYKNSISAGLFFQLSSRLARYTGNATYSDWASKSFTWTDSIGFIDQQWNVFDGASVTSNCSQINKIQSSYVAGTFITGAAHMYNVTNGDTQWKSVLDGLLNRTLSLFFPEGVAEEISCEPSNTCTTDMQAYKGILSRWLVDTIQSAPYTSSTILPNIRSSAIAAAKACNGSTCPLSVIGPSGTSPANLGNEMNALSVVQGLLVANASSPTSSATGGNNSTSTAGTGTAKPTGTSATGSKASPTGNSASTGAKHVGLASLAVLFGSVALMVL